ncbi:MAG TPA: hypothetical protein VKB40_10240, partial [Candidatus Acidoferrales bacterium]|nr:hypothetical protein [Candidatus Acidoferrales bacterium]
RPAAPLTEKDTIVVADFANSNVMGERLANGNIAVALLANTIATGTMPCLLLWAGWVGTKLGTLKNRPAMRANRKGFYQHDA